MSLVDCKQLRHEGPCQTEQITCRKCGDEVEMPKGKTWCWQCIEESAPVEVDQWKNAPEFV